MEKKKQDPVETLEGMKGKKMVYKRELVDILGYMYGCGETGLEVEIYTNQGVVNSDKFKIEKTLEEFTPADMLIVAAMNEERKKTTTLTADTVNEIRETVLGQIRKLKADPSAETIKQTKAISEAIGTLNDTARTEIEYRRLLDKLNSKK